MNFVAHAHVALRRAGTSWDVAFGAVLPDLASMAGTRIDRSLLSPPVEEGVALHHRTDGVFHALEVFHAGSGQIRHALLDVGVHAGPARAVGHAGYELLLDGCLLTRPGIEEEFIEVLTRAPDVAEAVPSADSDLWRRRFDRMRYERWWLGYKDPQMVARSLHLRLQDRRLLRFTAAELPGVAAVLTAARPGVDAGADDIVGAVAEAIRSDELGDDGVHGSGGGVLT
jgi:hypothetical protein